MGKTYDIVGLGECLVDFICSERDGKLFMEGNPGGAPANLLAMAAKLGKRVCLLTKVGKDSFGEFLAAKIAGAGIGADRMIFDRDHMTTLAIVKLTEGGERSFAFYRDATADVMYSADELDAELLRDTKIFHFGSLSLTTEPVRSATFEAIKLAKESGAKISYDPNWGPPLWKSRDEAVEMMRKGMEFADYVKVSEDELALITGQSDLNGGIVELLESFPVKLLAVTLGEKGSILVNRFSSVRQPAFEVECVDTTGAGDSFFGALLSALIEKDKSAELLTADEMAGLLKFANAAAGLCTTGKGGLSAVPDRDSVLALCEK